MDGSLAPEVINSSPFGASEQSEHPIRIWCYVCGKPESTNILAKPFFNIFRRDVSNDECNIIESLASALQAEVDEHNAPSQFICENCLNLAEKAKQLKHELLQVYQKMRNLHHYTRIKLEQKLLRPVPRSSPVRSKKSSKKIPLIPRPEHAQENFVPQLSKRVKPRKVHFSLDSNADDDFNYLQKQDVLNKKCFESVSFELPNTEYLYKPACLDIFQPDGISPEKCNQVPCIGQEKKRRREYDGGKTYQIHETSGSTEHCTLYRASREENYEDILKTKRQKMNSPQQLPIRLETGSFEHYRNETINPEKITDDMKGKHVTNGFNGNTTNKNKVPGEDFEWIENDLKKTVTAQILHQLNDNKHSKAAQTDDTTFSSLEKMCVTMKETFAISDDQNDSIIKNENEYEMESVSMSQNLLCDICGEDFTNQEQIKNHIEIHFTPNY